MVLKRFLFVKTIFLATILSISLAALSPATAIAGPPIGKLEKFAASRTWSDQSGNFKIEAKLADANSSEVKLKKADGRVVTVPLNALSDADKAFVETFLLAEEAIGGGAPANPFAGGEMEDASSGDASPSGDSGSGSSSKSNMFDLPVRKVSDRRTSPLNIDTSVAFWNAAPVTARNYAPAEEVSIALPMTKEFFAGAVMKISGAKPVAVIDVYKEDKFKKGDSYSRFGRIVLPDGEPLPLGADGGVWKLMAYSPDAKTMAAVRVTGFDKGSDLALFQMTSDGAKPMYEFQAGGGAWDELHWVGFLGDNRMATISQKHTMTIWDLEGPRAVTRAQVDGSLSAQIGGRGELLALPSNRGIAFLNGSNLKQVGFIPTKAGVAPQVSISPDGTRIAAFTPFEVQVFSLSDGEQINSISVAESNQNASIDWIGEYLLLNKSLLIDLEQGIPAWTYSSQATSQQVHGNLLYSLFAGDKSSTLVSTELPHPSAVRAISDADVSQMYVLQSGSPFTIKSNLSGLNPQEQAEAEKSVRAKLEEQGWQYSPSSPNIVELSLQQGEQTTEEYRTMGFGTDKVTYRPWTHSIVFKVDGAEVYRFQQVVGAGFMLSVNRGETSQQAVDRQVKPTLRIFTGARLPGRVLRPELRNGLGKSQITANGLK